MNSWNSHMIHKWSIPANHVWLSGVFLCSVHSLRSKLTLVIDGYCAAKNKWKIYNNTLWLYSYHNCCHHFWGFDCWSPWDGDGKRERIQLGPYPRDSKSQIFGTMLTVNYVFLRFPCWCKIGWFRSLNGWMVWFAYSFIFLLFVAIHTDRYIDGSIDR